MEGSASPYPTKPDEFLVGYTVALRTNRFAKGSQSEATASTWMPRHLLRHASRRRPVCVTYQLLLSKSKSPGAISTRKSCDRYFKVSTANFSKRGPHVLFATLRFRTYKSVVLFITSSPVTLL